MTAQDREAAFLIIVGDACVAAGRAGLQVSLMTRQGARHVGTPTSVPDDTQAAEVDDTGYGSPLSVGGTQVRLEDVVSCTVFRAR